MGLLFRALYVEKLAMDEATESSFKVIIVGAGITGLTLAHLLSLLGIDHQVIEAHKEIVHPAGGSFGIRPNAARILDQIGCWTDIVQISKPLDAAHIRRKDGSSRVTSHIYSHIAKE